MPQLGEVGRFASNNSLPGGCRLQPHIPDIFDLQALSPRTGVRSTRAATAWNRVGSSHLSSGGSAYAGMVTYVSKMHEIGLGLGHCKLSPATYCSMPRMRCLQCLGIVVARLSSWTAWPSKCLFQTSGLAPGWGKHSQLQGYQPRRLGRPRAWLGPRAALAPGRCSPIRPLS